jgi:hypothetical protein
MSVIILSLMMMLCVRTLDAIPNFYDPQNIIQTSQQGDSYWFFRLDEQRIALAEQYQATRDELISYSARAFNSFKEFAMNRIQTLQSENRAGNPEKIDTLNRALSLLEQSREALVKRLRATPIRPSIAPVRDKVLQELEETIGGAYGLGQSDREKLNAMSTIISGADVQSAKELFILKDQDKSKRVPIGAALLPLAKFENRAQIEKKYVELMDYMNGLDKREGLTKEDRKLIYQAQERVRQLYQSLIILPEYRLD